MVRRGLVFAAVRGGVEALKADGVVVNGAGWQAPTVEVTAVGE